MEKSKKLLLFAATIIVFVIISCNPKDETYKPNKERPQNYGDKLGVRDHFIRLDTARVWIKNYLNFRDSASSVRGQLKDTTLNYAESFHIEALKQLMQIPGCAGFRFYRGMKPGTLLPTLIIFAVDKNGKNLYLKKPVGRVGTNVILPTIKQTGGTSDPTEEGGLEYSQKDPADGILITNRTSLNNEIMKSLGGN